MIWCYIISLILFILYIGIFKSTKGSESYHYKEELAEYWKMPIWMLLLIIIAWIIPYANLVVSIVVVMIQICILIGEDSVKLVPRENTYFGKLLEFLTKEI